MSSQDPLNLARARAGESHPSDTFVVGLNLPWVRYGCDFGANAWQPGGGLAQAPHRRILEDALARLADSPVTSVRWFLLCDGRSGLAEQHGSGRLLPDSCLFRDLDVALSAARRHALRVMFVLFDFLWCARPRQHRGVVLGGRGHHLFDSARRAHLIDSLVAPIVAHCADDDTVVAWDLMNEPDWLVRWYHPVPWRWMAPRAALTDAFMDLVTAVRANAPQPVTVGVANQAGLDLVRDLSLDFYEVHWYDRFGLDAVLSQPVASLGLDRPVVLGEFPTQHTAIGPATIVRSARHLGYAGAYAWSLLARDDASGGTEALPSALQATGA